MIRPNLKEFVRLSRGATLVPVVKSISADLLDPGIGIFRDRRGRARCVSAGIGRGRREDRALHLPRGAAVSAPGVARPGDHHRARAQGGTALGGHFPGHQGTAAPTPSGGGGGAAAVHRGRGRVLCVRHCAPIGEYRCPCKRRLGSSRLRADVFRPRAGLRSPAAPDPHCGLGGCNAAGAASRLPAGPGGDLADREETGRGMEARVLAKDGVESEARGARPHSKGEVPRKRAAGQGVHRSRGHFSGRPLAALGLRTRRQAV